jgi:hypothetical protein
MLMLHAPCFNSSLSLKGECSVLDVFVYGVLHRSNSFLLTSYTTNGFCSVRRPAQNVTLTNQLAATTAMPCLHECKSTFKPQQVLISNTHCRKHVPNAIWDNFTTWQPQASPLQTVLLPLPLQFHLLLLLLLLSPAH